MRRSWLVGVGLILFSAVGFAQSRGGGMGGGSRGGAPAGPRAAPAMTTDEKQRAQTAAEWADVIEKARARVPQHPPDSVIHFPSKNATFIATLRFAEAPRVELERYLDKLWSQTAEPVGRRVALAGLWQEAEKPLWIRPVVEEFFRKRAGASLRPPAEPEVAELKSADAKTETGTATKTETGTATKTETKTADAKSETKTADAKSETKSADAKSETKSAETKSAETKSADAKSADKGPTQ